MTVMMQGIDRDCALTKRPGECWYSLLLERSRSSASKASDLTRSERASVAALSYYLFFAAA